MKTFLFTRRKNSQIFMYFCIAFRGKPRLTRTLHQHDANTPSPRHKHCTARTTFLHRYDCIFLLTGSRRFRFFKSFNLFNLNPNLNFPSGWRLSLLLSLWLTSSPSRVIHCRHRHDFCAQPEAQGLYAYPAGTCGQHMADFVHENHDADTEKAYENGDDRRPGEAHLISIFLMT